MMTAGLDEIGPQLDAPGHRQRPDPRRRSGSGRRRLLGGWSAVASVAAALSPSNVQE
jgi:hypothetical protein